MNFKESLQQLRNMTDEEIEVLAEKAITGKELVSYEGMDAFTSALMGFYNGELKKKSNNGHAHTKEEITNFPTSLKNPSSLTIQANGTNLGSYDGSSTQTFNVTANGVGAYTKGEVDSKLGGKAPSSHTHQATQVTQDGTHRFVTDAEKNAWNGKLDKSGVVNNLDSNDGTKALSAAMGKLLRERIYYKTDSFKIVYGTDRMRYAIGIVNVDNTEISRQSTFNGMMTISRANGLYCPITAIINLTKRYDTDSIYCSSILSGTAPISFSPCTFTYQGKKYGGFNIFVDPATFCDLELIGTFLNTHTPICIPFYNEIDKKVVNEEIYNSMKTIDFTNKDVYNSGHIIYDSHNFNPNTKLNTSGGTISGALTVTGNVVTNGTATVNGLLTANDVYLTSDRRAKTNLEIIDNPLEKIKKINGYLFDWVSTKEKSSGVIAQEVEEILPSIVYDKGNGKKVNYNGIIALLVESNKELLKRIEVLESKVR